MKHNWRLLFTDDFSPERIQVDVSAQAAELIYNEDNGTILLRADGVELVFYGDEPEFFKAEREKREWKKELG